jgi:hypothetical protein
MYFNFLSGYCFNEDYPDTLSGLFSGILGFPHLLSLRISFLSAFLYYEYVALLQKCSKKKGKSADKCTAGFVLFFIISGAWIMIISDKYGRLLFQQ